MVAQQILVLFVRVRIRVRQQINIDYQSLDWKSKYLGKNRFVFMIKRLILPRIRTIIYLQYSNNEQTPLIVSTKNGGGLSCRFCFLPAIYVALIPTLFDIRLIPANQGRGFGIIM